MDFYKFRDDDFFVNNVGEQRLQSAGGRIRVAYTHAAACLLGDK